MLIDLPADTAARLLLSAARSGDCVISLNAELIARTDRSPDFFKRIMACRWFVCDGAGAACVLNLRRRYSCKPPVKRLTGIELGEALLYEAACQSRSVFFLGGRSGIARSAALRWHDKYPALSIAGWADGYFQAEENEMLCRLIDSSGAEIVVVCLGSPAQENWIFDNRHRLPGVHLFLPLGGSLDVWAGKVKRAPVCFRHMGIEWLWRLCHQPKRAGRILFAANGLFRAVVHGTAQSALHAFESSPVISMVQSKWKREARKQPISRNLFWGDFPRNRTADLVEGDRK